MKIVEGDDGDVLDMLSGTGRKDIVIAFETISRECWRRMRYLGPLMEEDDNGKYSVSVMLCEAESKGNGLFLANDELREVVEGGDFAAASERLVSRILEVVPEVRTYVRMTLEIRGFDAGWV